MRALVIGGTGPTGHFVVNGLIARGFEVSILHTGNHEVARFPHPWSTFIPTRSMSRR